MPAPPNSCGELAGGGGGSTRWPYGISGIIVLLVTPLPLLHTQQPGLYTTWLLARDRFLLWLRQRPGTAGLSIAAFTAAPSALQRAANAPMQVVAASWVPGARPGLRVQQQRRQPGRQQMRPTRCEVARPGGGARDDELRDQATTAPSPDSESVPAPRVTGAIPGCLL